jgi:hypothetical protein
MINTIQKELNHLLKVKSIQQPNLSGILFIQTISDISVDTLKNAGKYLMDKYPRWVFTYSITPTNGKTVLKIHMK